MDAWLNESSNKPPTIDEVFQPWELLGESRRDCEPHRGRLLRRLARISLLTGGLSFLCPPLALIGLPMGLLIRMLARRDLDAIFAGEMDHRGYAETEKARNDSHAGVVVSWLGLLFWSVMLAGFVLCIVFRPL